MPPAQPMPFALHAVDGGLATDCESSIDVHLAHDADAAPPSLARAAREVLHAASRRLRVETGTLRATRLAHTGPAASRPAIQLQCAANRLALVPDSTAVRVDHLRSYRPCLRATASALDLLVITDAGSPAGGNGPVSTSTFEYALRHARRLARTRIRILVEDDPTQSAAARTDTRFDTIADAYPDIDVALLPAGDALRALTAGRDVADVLVAAPRLAALLRPLALGLAGDYSLATSTVIEPSGEARFYRTDTAAPPSLEALLLCAAQLLMHAGVQEDGVALADAVLRTLEDGAHTGAIALLNPYARCLADAPFADAVVDRLGQRPSRLSAVFGGLAPATPARPVHLRVVSSD